jgi:hypothetical protein
LSDLEQLECTLELEESCLAGNPWMCDREIAVG